MAGASNRFFPRTQTALSGNASWLKFVLCGSDPGKSPASDNVQVKTTFGWVPAQDWIQDLFLRGRPHLLGSGSYEKEEQVFLVWTSQRRKNGSCWMGQGHLVSLRRWHLLGGDMRQQEWKCTSLGEGKACELRLYNNSPGSVSGPEPQEPFPALLCILWIVSRNDRFSWACRSVMNDWGRSARISVSTKALWVSYPMSSCYFSALKASIFSTQLTFLLFPGLQIH